MQIHISPRNVTLTASVHQYVAEKIGHLEHLNERLLATHVVLWHDTSRHRKEEYVVKVHVGLPGPDLHAESCAMDLFSAIDLVTDKLSRQLRKHKTRVFKRRLSKARHAKSARKGRTV